MLKLYLVGGFFCIIFCELKELNSRIFFDFFFNGLFILKVWSLGRRRVIFISGRRFFFFLLRDGVWVGIYGMIFGEIIEDFFLG